MNGKNKKIRQIEDMTAKKCLLKPRVLDLTFVVGDAIVKTLCPV